LIFQEFEKTNKIDQTKTKLSMKKTIVALLVVAFAPAVMAQGSINFNNFGGGIVTIGGGPQDGFFGGTEYNVQLFTAPLGTTDPSAFIPFGSPIQLGFGPTAPNQDAGAGFYDGGTLDLNPAGSPAQVLAFVMGSGGGSNGTQPGSGMSQIVTLDLAYGPQPVNDINTAPWSIVVPEPTTFALAGLGAAALLIFRRRD
jgi:hypothetical protein